MAEQSKPELPMNLPYAGKIRFVVSGSMKVTSESDKVVVEKKD